MYILSLNSSKKSDAFNKDKTLSENKQKVLNMINLIISQVTFTNMIKLIISQVTFTNMIKLIISQITFTNMINLIISQVTFTNMIKHFPCQDLGDSVSYVVGLPNNSYNPNTNTSWDHARLCK
jgi:hypothetical protein